MSALSFYLPLKGKETPPLLIVLLTARATQLVGVQHTQRGRNASSAADARGPELTSREAWHTLGSLCGLRMCWAGLSRVCPQGRSQLGGRRPGDREGAFEASSVVSAATRHWLFRRRPNKDKEVEAT